MVVVWNTLNISKGGEVTILAKAHTDVDIHTMKVAFFDDTRCHSSLCLCFLDAHLTKPSVCLQIWENFMHFHPSVDSLRVNLDDIVSSAHYTFYILYHVMLKQIKDGIFFFIHVSCGRKS